MKDKFDFDVANKLIQQEGPKAPRLRYESKQHKFFHEGQYDLDLTPLNIEEDEGSQGDVSPVLKQNMTYNQGKYQDKNEQCFSFIA